MAESTILDEVIFLITVVKYCKWNLWIWFFSVIVVSYHKEIEQKQLGMMIYAQFEVLIG